MRESVLKQKSYVFAIECIKLCQKLINKREYILSRQLIRSGTSVGANIREAQNAVSPKDFIYKLSISAKEIDESGYWLELLRDSNWISIEEFNKLYPLHLEIQKMISSSILTVKQRHASKLKKRLYPHN